MVIFVLMGTCIHFGTCMCTAVIFLEMILIFTVYFMSWHQVIN